MRTCIRLCRKRRSQFDMQGARRGPRNGRAGWIDYRPKCHVGGFVEEEGGGGGWGARRLLLVGHWARIGAWRGETDNAGHLACSHVRKRYDTSYSWTTRLMAGARRKQSAARIQKVHVQRESQVTRENVFLFVPNLIGVYCLG